jgi:hypothetical protein
MAATISSLTGLSWLSVATTSSPITVTAQGPDQSDVQKQLRVSV